MALYNIQTIADLDEARQRRREDQMPVVVGRPAGMNPSDRLRFAMSVLRYNQGFVTFTDGKANSLLLVNSIFLATVASAGMGSALSLAAVVTAGLAVLLCLGVVWARLSQQGSRERGQVVFFGHIRKRRSATVYQEDFLEAAPNELIESTVRQVYDLAGVVEKKFAAYRWAQLATILSAALWISNLIAPRILA